MSKYKSGRRAETELVKMLRELGYFAIRVFGSGRRFKFPVPDVIAISPKFRLFFQVKRTTIDQKEKIYISKKDAEQLYKCSNLAGAEPFFACKFPRGKIRIAFPDELKTTKDGNYIFENINGIPIDKLSRGD